MSGNDNNGKVRRSQGQEFDLAKKEVSRRDDLAVWFSRIATDTARWVGSPLAFLLACASVIVWGALGPLYGYSDTWQLVVNTATTILTFLIVFLIQNTQNRDAKALHLKLDEVIRSIHQAHNEMIDIENLSDKELDELKARYEQIRCEWDERHRDRETTHRGKPAA
jgi:low affinity Fe/Cu permease